MVRALDGMRALLWAGLCCIAGAAAANPAATADDALPPAVLGKAPPLAGRPLAYFDADSDATGYLAEPAGPGPHGAVILIHEWNGLVDRVREVADAFAAEGYLALAVDLYSGRTGRNPEENMALVRETLADEAALIANLEAAAAHLEGRDDSSGRIAAIGWCYGGGVALSYALGSDSHDATAIFYGRLLDDPARLASLHHPVYGTFVENDSGIPVEQVDRFVEALRAAGIDNDVHIYDEVRHGFWLHVDRDPQTNRGPALDAWQRLKAFLGETLGG